MVSNAIIETTNLSVVETSPDFVKKQVEKIKMLQATILAVLKDGIDYGKIPYCGDRPTLFKSGAEKILITFGLQSTYEVIESKTDYDGKGFFSYTVKSCIYSNGVKVTEGLGHANSKEIKFAFKWVTKNRLPKELNPELLPSRKKDGEHGEYWEYRVEEDMNSKANTILKMAKKRAQVDGVLTVANLSELFTQDFDDLLDGIETPKDMVEKLKEQIKSKTKSKTKAKTDTKQDDYICAGCGKSIQEAAFKYSQDKYKKPLCYNCQQKARAHKAS